MPFTPITCVNGVTPINATFGNNAQTQYTEATLSYGPDTFPAGYVAYGYICYKDASTANKLDVTNGDAYLLQADGTTRQRSLATSTQTTSALNSTYNLYLQPDGTWYWSTSNSPAANSLFIATVTTDGSGNILVVTDKRPLIANAFPALAGTLELPAPLAIQQTQNPTLAGAVAGGVTFGQKGALASDYNAAALFNGTSGWISCPTTSLPSGNAAWTTEYWVNIPSTPSGTPIALRWGTNAANQSVDLDINNSAKVVGGFVAGTQVTSPSAISTNAWHHCVCTYDGTNLNLYVDGSLVAGPTAATAGNIVLTGMAIGSIVGGGSNFFSGSLDEVALYSTALSSSRVSAHFNAATSTTTGAYAAAVLADSPLRYYRLGDAVGSSSAADTISATQLQIAGPDGTITTPSKYLWNQASSGSGWLTAIDLEPSGTTVVNPWKVLYNGGTGQLMFFDATNGMNQLLIAPGPGNTGATTITGPIGGVGGQATAGSFGVPVIVAQALQTSVSSTGAVNIVDYVTPAAGLYMCCMTAYVNNGVSGNKIELLCHWTGNTGSQSGTFFMNNNAQSYAGSGGSLSVTNGDWPANPITIHAASGTHITLIYQDPTNTPNDKVDAQVIRLG